MIIGLILSAIFVFIGVNIIPAINESSEATEGTTSSGFAGLSGVIMILFASMIIFGVVKSMSDIGGDGERRVTKVKREVVKAFRNSKEFVLKIETASQKYQKFVQNLDELLGVTTKTVDNPDKALELIKLGIPNENGKNYQLDISSSFDWYIADKHPNLYMFKIVGLHKKDNKKNVACIIGKDDDNDAPYLINVPTEYLETKFQYLSKTNWWKQNEELSEKVNSK